MKNGRRVWLSCLAVSLLMWIVLVNSSFAQIPVYRFYSDGLRTHLYTIDENEKTYLENHTGWLYEGVAWNAYATQEAGTLPVYRFYAAKTSSHLYTMDENEKAVLMSGSTWLYEGVAYYAYPGANGSATPIYRLYSELLRRHLFTADANEASVLDAGPNWIGEGIAWYVGDGGGVIPPGPAVCSGGTLYDDFSGTTLSADKWRQPGTKIRVIETGKLVMELGGRLDPWHSLFNQLGFTNPNSVNAIEVKVNVKSSQITLVNEFDGVVNATIDGMWYQSASGPIWAGVFLEDTGHGQLNASYGWNEFDGSNGDHGMFMDASGVPVAFNYNTEYTLKIEYDGNNTFTFSIDSYSATMTGPARTGTSSEEWKSIFTSVNAWNDNNPVQGSIAVTFDDVRINNSAGYYDQFDAVLLNSSNWRTGRETQLEYVQDISDGRLNLHVRGVDGRNTVRTLIPTKQNYVETPAMIKSGSQLSPGAFGIARIGADFYNDMHGPGSGSDYNKGEGQVWVENRLYLTDDGTLGAQARVWRSNDANYSDGTMLFKENFQTPINFDTFYRISIEFTGSELIFKCNDEIFRYTITTPTYDSFYPGIGLHSRVYADPGQSGYMKTAFNYVCVQ